MDPTQPADPPLRNGLGTKVTLGTLLASLAATATAIADAGITFYQDNGVITLIIGTIALAAAFFGGRSVQAKGAIEKSVAIAGQATAIADQVEAHVAEVIAAYRTAVETGVIPAPAPLPSQPGEQVPAPPGTDVGDQVGDVGGAGPSQGLPQG